MRCVFVLACLVGRVAAQPSIRTFGGNIIMNGEDLRFTHNDGIGTPISLTESKAGPLKGDEIISCRAGRGICEATSQPRARGTSGGIA